MMDWQTLLTPIESLALTVITGLALNAGRKWLTTNTGIAVSDDEFDAAKKAVLAVEEKYLAKTVTFASGAAKKGLAAEMLVSARPATKNVAGVLVDQAVAILPGIGATGKLPVKINLNQAAG